MADATESLLPPSATTDAFATDDLPATLDDPPATPGDAPEPSPRSDGTGSVPGTIFNLTNTIIGSGTLAMPLAFESSGYVGGVVLLVGAWFLSAFAMYLLTYASKKTQLTTYKEIARKVGGPVVSVLVQLSIFCYTTGTCIAYPIFLGGFIPHIISAFLPNSVLVDRHLDIMVMSFLIIYPISMFKNLSALRFTSFLSLICIIYTTVACVVEFGTRYVDNVSLHPPVWFNPSIMFFRGFPYMTCAFTAHYNVLRFYTELRNRSVTKMNVIIGASTFISFSVYLLVGLFGYFSLNPTLSGDVLVDYPNDDYVMLASCFMFCFVMSVSFPLVHHAQRDLLDKLAFAGWRESSTRRCTLSFLLISVAMFCAVALKQISMVLGYNGSIFGVLVVYIFPSFFVFRIEERWGVMKVVCLLMMILGFILMAFGIVITTIFDVIYPLTSSSSASADSSESFSLSSL